MKLFDIQLNMYDSNAIFTMVAFIVWGPLGAESTHDDEYRLACHAFLSQSVLNGKGY